ncbi:transmembrane protein 272-like [Hyla sarda]|uniref:transmembrane protein 272-like n=1 Tax=Hyla sarda TaxID=327740 RepID=UPI0024C26785|nr:transmembrane protein 272-like [Hyla sarda]
MASDQINTPKPKKHTTDSVVANAEGNPEYKLLIQEVQNLHNRVIYYLQISAVIVWIILGIAMIVVGGLYKDDCLIQPNIPIFLLVTGVAHFVISSILLLRILRNLFSVFLDTVILIFMFSWFITGSFWIFYMFDQKEGKCATHLYLFAYGTMTFEWIILWLACMCYCFSKLERSNEDPALQRAMTFPLGSPSPTTPSATSQHYYWTLNRKKQVNMEI